ncbi:MAG: 2-nitropropane dioxygenase [Nitrospinales bacterium]
MAYKILKIECPCCESKLHVDSKTGEVIWKDEKKKELSSLTDMVKGLDAQKKEQDSLFKKQSELQKERSRLLNEKFNESQKHVDKSGDKPLRDFDFD